MKPLQTFIGSCLAFCLVGSLIPVPALAQEVIETEPVVEEVIGVQEMVSEEAVAAVTATKTEAWIQEQIDNGVTEIYIDDAIVLENDFTITSRVQLFLRYGSITVPNGKNMTNHTAQINVWEGGSLTVENGGSLVNNSEIIVSGTFAVYGTFEGIVHTYYWTDKANATIIGVPNSNIWMHYVVEEGSAAANLAKFLENWALMESTNYGCYSQQIHGDMTLPSDIVIPSNCWFVLEVQSLTFTIPAGRKITNYGEFLVYGNQAVENYGTFENAGYLNIQGRWTGNEPVTAKMTQDQLEEALAQTNFYQLYADVTLERDLVIDGEDLGLSIIGSLTVPEGITLTIGNGGYIQVDLEGVLDVRGNIEINYTNGWPYRVNLFYRNGNVSNVKGVPDEYFVLNCPVSNESELQDALAYVAGTNCGFDIVRVTNSITLTQNITIPENTCLRLQNNATLTIPVGCTLTHNGLEVQVYSGHLLQNNGTIQNNAAFWITDSGKLVNNGTFVNNGQVHMNGIWEGNQPVTSHDHTFSKSVTDPTCTENGYTTYTCNVCSYSYTDNTVYATGLHIFSNDQDTACDTCGYVRELRDSRTVVHMFRMYDPNSGEHFYTGSEEERENLVAAGWNYEGVGFTFPLTTGKPVYRLYDRNNTYEHLYTMDEAEKSLLMSQGWEYEGIAFNSGFEDEVPQYRMHNPNETRGAYHFTSSLEERENLLAAGWEYQGIGWYSCWK